MFRKRKAVAAIVIQNALKTEKKTKKLRAKIDDQVFSARTLAKALMQLFPVCKWPSKNILQRLQKRCRSVFLRRVNGFLQDFGKLSSILK